MKILSVVGARPQFVKTAMVSRALATHDEVCEVLVHTGQHYDDTMSAVFFRELGIREPDHNLGVGSGSHGEQTGQMLAGLERVIQSEKPNWVVVHGDTNSTLAGALAAAKLHVPVAHVEAGLRSFNRHMPEEVNRVLTDHVSTLLFAPTKVAQCNLLAEGIAQEKIIVVGDVMYDALLHYKEQTAQPSWFNTTGVPLGAFVLCTIHRQENTDDSVRLGAIFDGLNESNLPVILPLHPRTKMRMSKINLQLGENIKIVDPVGYMEMMWLEANCRIIATDSGGVQKEAYFHQKPCVTVRDETEWVELVEAGVNRLVGADTSKIVDCLICDDWPAFDEEIYGKGDAASKIVELIVEYRP